MKHLACLFLLFSTITATAQTLPVPSYWQGELPSGKKFVVAFHFAADSTGEIKATMDSPGENMLGIKTNLSQRNDSLFIDITSIKAVFEGKIHGADSISGRWKQSTIITPLQLNKKIFPVQYSKIKSQAPVPPFPYYSEDVEYDNADKTVHLGATITRPDKPGTYPAVILITGSGQQDRNETIMGHKPFAVIADHLSRNGFLVMRVDDRGMGKSKGDLKTATSADFAKDVETSLNFLLQRGDVNKKKIGLMGHSEGGMIAPMVAVNRKEISFLVLLAGPGYSMSEVMADQNEAYLKQSGYSNETAARYRSFYIQLISAITSAPDDSIALQKGIPIFNAWQQTENPGIVASLTGTLGNNSPANFVKIFVAQLKGAWWKYFLSYDPQANLKRLNIPVLALNGSKDIQVLPRSLEYIKKANPKKNTVEALPALNHLFQHCYYCTVAEYGQLEETFSADALKKITAWMKEVTK